MGDFSCFLCTRIAVAHAHALLIIALFLKVSSTQSSLASRARCLGPPHVGALKVGVVGMGSKLFALQGKAASWGLAPDCMALR